MPKAQRCGSNQNRRTLERDEGPFLTNQLAVVAVLELGHTVRAAGEDNDNRHRQAGEKRLEAPVKRRGAAGAQVPHHVVGEAGDESRQHNDLQGQAGHGDVDARVVGAAGLGGQRAAGGLQDEADNVKGDEDPVEELWLEAGELGRKVDDGFREGDVDGRGEEDGGEGDADCVRVCVSIFLSFELGMLVWANKETY